MEPVHKVEQPAATDLGALLDAGDDAMVTLVAGDTRLAAHRAVLEARSPVFSGMFNHDTLEARRREVEIPDVEGAVLRQLLVFLYTLQLPQLPDMAAQLLAASDKYGVLALKEHCEKQLAAQLSVETAAAAAVLAVRHSCSSLRQAAVSFIKAHTHQVMATQDWADAVRNQPEDVVEVSRLLSEQPQETSAPPTAAHSGTPAVAAPPTAALDDDTVARMWSLPRWQRDSRLREAAKQGAVEEVRALLAAGAAVEDRGDWGWTALHYAACCGHAAVVRALLAASAEANLRTTGDLGWTPLHWAACGGHTEAQAALLEGGADSTVRDTCGRTPLDVAREFNRQSVVQLLSDR